MLRLVLASASPRRKSLLEKLNIEFDVIVSNADENIKYNGFPDKYVIELSSIKAKTVLNTIDFPAVVVGCDTIVCIDKKILGKPVDEDDAYNMLKLLSGRVHRVYTGISVISKDNITSYASYSDVKMYSISDSEIKSYIETKEPMDKAGAYGIQGKGSLLVESIEGNFDTIVGLNVSILYRMLKEHGFNIMDFWKK